MAILLLPIMWLNHGSSHDWGGDFSMYLIQAKNLVQGVCQSDTGYIYNPEFARNGPSNYPVGYPLILSPVYAIWGHNMTVLNLFQSVLAFLFGLTFFAFLKRHFTWITAALVVLVLIYNPWFLYFKRELMSDIPFSILVLLFLMAIRSKQKHWTIGLLAVLMILFRGIGWFSIPLLIIPVFISSIQNPEKRTQLLQVLSISVTVAIAVFIINRLVFNLPMSTQSYSDQLIPADILQNISGNFLYFKDVVADHLFRYWEDSRVLSVSAISVYALLILVGASRSFRKHPIYIWTILIYGIIILVYPYRYSGFRFILPVHGIMLALAAKGLYSLTPKMLSKKWLIILFFGGYMSTHLPWWQTIVKQQSIVQSGPHHPESVAMFSFLNNEPDQTGSVIFIKPRVLSLFGDRSAVSNEPHGSQEEIRVLINDHGITGLMLCKDVPHPSLQQFVADNQTILSLKFENDKFQYYGIDNP